MSRGVILFAARHPVVKPVGLSAFWVALAVWSWLLVKPNPFPETARTLSEWGELLPYLAAKSLHAGVYATLTLLAAASSSPRRRVGMVLLMAAHGVLSELGQYCGNLWYGTGRVGSVKDVLVDWAGVAVGYTVWRNAVRLLARRGAGSGGEKTTLVAPASGVSRPLQEVRSGEENAGTTREAHGSEP